MLWSFAVVQPLLNVLGDAPEFFVARQNTSADIVVLALAATLVPPAVLLLAEAVAGRISAPAGRGLHLALVGLLVAAIALQVLKKGPGGGSALMIAVAVVLGAAGALAYARTRAAPTVLTVLAPAPVVFLVAFLVVSPVSKLVFPSDAAKASRATIPGRTPVVMILLDELSGISLLGGDRRIDAARLPSFARLARDATWYRNATAVADFTDRAVPAILTGERPTRGSIPTSADHPHSLFTFLGGSYAFDVTEPITDLCPPALCPSESRDRPSMGRRLRGLASDLPIVSAHLLLPDALARDLPPVDRSFGDFAGGAAAQEGDGGARLEAAVQAGIERRPQFLGFARRLGEPSARRRLSFLHVQFPHHPFAYLPSGQRYPNADAQPPGLREAGAPAGVWTADAPLVRQSELRYLLQLGYADRLLGHALDRLRAAGLYDRSLVVVMADHGAAFTPGAPFRAVTAANLPEIASIPLLVKAPGQRRGAIDDRNVRAIDVLPTIAAALGARLPWRTEGVRAGTARARSVELQTHAGRTLSVPFAEFVRRRDAVAARTARAFGFGRRDGLFASGPGAELLGRRPAALGTVTRPAGRFALDDPSLLGLVNPDGPFVPSLLGGRASGVPAGGRLALTLDGRVAAVAATYRDGGALRFAAIVPPSAFVRGANRVGVVRVAGSGARRTVTPLRGGAGSFRLVRAGGRELLVDEAGRRLAIGPGATGRVQSTTVADGQVELNGWAADRALRRPADQVVAFAGSRFLTTAPPSQGVLGAPSAPPRSGFKLRFWQASLRGVPASAPLRVLAVSGGRATPLPGARRP